MNRIDPPLDPNQLPPKTDDFTFCNVSSHPIPPIDFHAYEGGLDMPLLMQAPNPGHTGVGYAYMDIWADRVTCHADVAGVPFDYEYSDTPPGWFVAKFICGVQNGKMGMPVPFGLVILRERNGGPGVQAVALQYQDHIDMAEA